MPRANKSKRPQLRRAQNSPGPFALASANGSAIRMQVLEANHWVDVHTRCHTEDGMKRIYKAFLKDNALPHRSVEPVCGMRIITVHFEHLGAFPRKSPNGALCDGDEPPQTLKSKQS